MAPKPYTPHPWCPPCAQNERGISAVGVAVGFNRLEVVKLLIAKGGDLSFRDPKKNTLMHYAAGGSGLRGLQPYSEGLAHHGTLTVRVLHPEHLCLTSPALLPCSGQVTGGWPLPGRCWPPAPS